LGWLGLGLALVAYGVLAAGYATLTPIWQNPDEPAHYNYVAFVAETGGLPELKQGDWDSALLERLKNGTLEPGNSIAAIRYESWQPPLFYLLAAPIYRLGPSDSATRVVPRLRALNVVFGAITLILAYCVARHVFEPPLAAAVPLVMVGVPMFVAVSAAVSADPLANLLAAAILLALLRPIEARGWSVLVGALIGLGVLTKLELGIFVPIVLGVIIARAPRNRSLRECVVVLVTTGAVVAPWLVHQVTAYGWTDPLAVARHSAVVADQPRFPGFSGSWLGDFLTTSFHSFWAQFGWMAIVAPVRLYVVWGGVAVLALVGLVVHRSWLRHPALLLMLSVVGVAAVAYVGYNLAFVQFQARYLFTALTPIATLLVLGWAAILPKRSVPWSVLVLSVALICLNGYTLLRVLVPGFAPTG
jgi:4-amino-4-deoxy-L-arabinose transferase-like glycosyltransferase